MDLGAAFVTWCPYRGWVEAEVTWTGGMMLLATAESASVPMGSSLSDSGSGLAPAKPLGSGGSRGTRGNGVVSQSLGRV